MQIQAITNNFNCKTYQSQNKNNTLNFKGELGKQVLYGISTSKGVHKNLLPSVIKIYKIGSFWGRTSVSKLMDILETFIDRINSSDAKIAQMSNEMSNMTSDILKREKDLETKNKNLKQKQEELEANQKKLASEKQTFEEEKLATEKNLNTLQNNLDNRQAQLDDKEKEFDNRIKTERENLDTRKSTLDALEQKIISETKANTTEAIRKEEKQAALEALSEERVDLAKREADLKRKEQALINAENMLRQSEIEQRQSDFRVLYNISDPQISVYNHLPEQIATITQILNKYSERLKGISISTPSNVIKLLQDNEGVITRDKIQLLERMLKTDKICDTQDLSHAIKMVMDVSNNMEDSDKVAYFISLLALNNTSFVAAIKFYASHYNIESDYNNIEDGKVIDTVHKLEEDQVSSGLNAYGYRPNIEKAEKLYNGFKKIRNLSLYSLDELNESIRLINNLRSTETNRIMHENFSDMLNIIKEAINSRQQI